MDIVGACEDQSSDQLPAWTSNRFVVFLERDPAGLPPRLGLLEGGSPALEERALPGATGKTGACRSRNAQENIVQPVLEPQGWARTRAVGTLGRFNRRPSIEAKETQYLWLRPSASLEE